MSESDESKIESLLSFGFEGIDAVRARNVLQNHGWNLEQAIDNLLGVGGAAHDDMPPLLPSIAEWAPAEPNPWGQVQTDATNAWGTTPISQPSEDVNSRPTVPAHSMQSVQELGQNYLQTLGLPDAPLAPALSSKPLPPVFGPSNREDVEQKWAMVPTKPQASKEASDIDKAIEASLNDSYSKIEAYEELPLEKRKRLPHGPVALRLTQPIQQDALYLQALYAVPQVRRAVMEFTPVSGETPKDKLYWEGHDSYPFGAALDTHTIDVVRIHQLQRLFSFMELSERAYLNVDETVRNLQGNESSPPPSPSRAQLLSVISRAWSEAASAISSDSVSVASPARLFLSQVEDDLSDQVHNIDVIDLQPRQGANDLYTCMRHRLSGAAFNESADTLIFHIIRLPNEDMPSSSLTERQPLSFPHAFFCDQFMESNRTLVAKRQEIRQSAELNIALLKAKRQSLLYPNGKDILKSLNSVLLYFEDFAKASDLGRKSSQETARDRLRMIIRRIQAESEKIDSEEASAQSDLASAFQTSELRSHEYRLRAAVIEDGLYGRQHMFAYVADSMQRWWKITDHEVLEVSSDAVIGDTTGLHLGAGPFMLFYSREEPHQISQEGIMQTLPIPDPYRMYVMEDNANFRAELAGEAEPADERPSTDTALQDMLVSDDTRMGVYTEGL